MEYVLLVMWTFGASGASSYSVDFASLDACEATRLALVGEERRMVVEAASTVGTKTSYGATILSAGPAPRLSAICVKRK